MVYRRVLCMDKCVGMPPHRMYTYTVPCSVLVFVIPCITSTLLKYHRSQCNTRYVIALCLYVVWRCTANCTSVLCTTWSSTTWMVLCYLLLCVQEQSVEFTHYNILNDSLAPIPVHAVHFHKECDLMESRYCLS